MFDGFKRSIVSVDGIDISYVTGGSGRPVLMLHGFPQSLSMWARVALQLAGQFTIVCADLRGTWRPLFVDQFPDVIARTLQEFLTLHR